MIIYFILGAIICILIYVVRNLSKKNNVYEGMLEESENSRIIVMNKIIKWMELSLEKLHNIDRLQIFEGDDDVGWFFQTLKFQITELNNQIAIIFEEEQDEKNKEEEK